MQIPSQRLHAAGDFVEPCEIVEKAADVVTGLRQLVVWIWDGKRAVSALLEHIDLAFDPEVETKSHFGRLSQHLLQRHARVQRVRRALVEVVGRHPRDFGLPGQLDDLAEIRHRGDLVVIWFLAKSVERVACVAFGSVRHMAEMRKRHHLSLRDTMDVDIRTDAIFDAAFLQLPLKAEDGVLRIHWATSLF